MSSTEMSIDEHHVVVLRVAGHFGETHHRSVGVHEFAENARFLKTGETAEINGGFRVTAANEGAPLSRAKRINVTGTAQVRGLPFGIGRGLDREESVVRAHARRHAFGGFDRHREGSALRVGVVRNHRRKFHAVASLFREAHAHDPRAVADHLRHLFFGEVFGAENEVALVFTVFVVHHAEAFPARKALEGLFHAFDRIASEIFERQIESRPKSSSVSSVFSIVVLQKSRKPALYGISFACLFAFRVFL